MLLALPFQCRVQCFFFLCSFGFCWLFSCFLLFSMAQPLSYTSMTHERSRSRDDPPMWGHPNLDGPHGPTHQRSWNYTPALRRTRRVLIIIDLDQIQHLMTEHRSDVMQVTTCEHLPNLSQSEQMALFTYCFLLTPGQIQIMSVDNILHYISQHINNTWGTYLEPTSMDLRWSDCTGDTFALRSHQTIIRLRRIYVNIVHTGPRLRK